MMLGFLTAQIVANGIPQDVNHGDFSNKVMSTTELIEPKLDVACLSGLADSTPPKLSATCSEPAKEA